jgi:hypothetical protein
MEANNGELARVLIQALIDDWALVEDVEDDERLVLVNESRDEMEGLRPARSFVAWLETQGYVENRGIPLDAEPEYNEYTKWSPEEGVNICSMRTPHVFAFSPTPKGLALLSTSGT